MSGRIASRDRSRPLTQIARAIGLITLATGALQVVAPAFVLRRIGGEERAVSTHLFATIGFFMTVVGGLLAETAGRERPDAAVVAASIVQKAGATTAMAVGYLRGIFSPFALLVAAFDGVSAVLLMLLRGSMRAGGSR